MDTSKYSSPSLPCQDQETVITQGAARSLVHIPSLFPKSPSRSPSPATSDVAPLAPLSSQHTTLPNRLWNEERMYQPDTFSRYHSTMSFYHAAPHPAHERTVSSSDADVHDAYFSFPPYYVAVPEGINPRTNPFVELTDLLDPESGLVGLPLVSVDNAADCENAGQEAEHGHFSPMLRTLRTTSTSMHNARRTEVAVVVRKPSWRQRITGLLGGWADKYANRFSQEQSEIVAIQQIAQRQGFVHTYRCEHGHIHLLNRQKPPRGDIQDGIGQCPFKRPRKTYDFGPDPRVDGGTKHQGRQDTVRVASVASRT
jgi:hypothetical protein